MDLHAGPWRRLAAFSHPANLMMLTNHRPVTGRLLEEIGGRAQLRATGGTACLRRGTLASRFGMTVELQQLLFLLIIGFGCGYIVREVIAGRRTPEILAMSPWP